MALKDQTIAKWVLLIIYDLWFDSQSTFPLKNVQHLGYVSKNKNNI